MFGLDLVGHQDIVHKMQEQLFWKEWEAESSDNESSCSENSTQADVHAMHTFCTRPGRRLIAGLLVCLTITTTSTAGMIKSCTLSSFSV